MRFARKTHTFLPTTPSSSPEVALSRTTMPTIPQCFMCHYILVCVSTACAKFAFKVSQLYQSPIGFLGLDKKSHRGNVFDKRCYLNNQRTFIDIAAYLLFYFSRQWLLNTLCSELSTVIVNIRETVERRKRQKPLKQHLKERKYPFFEPIIHWLLYPFKQAGVLCTV